MARHRGLRIFAIIFTFLTIKFLSVDGRKCFCTSKGCLETGTYTCRTRFSCYTELMLYDDGQENTTSHGCTDTPWPVLCNRGPRSAVPEINDTASAGSPQGQLRVPWPRFSLNCCDSRDYCNGGIPGIRGDDRKPTSNLNLNRDTGVVNGAADTMEQPSDPPDRYRDKKPMDSAPSSSSSSTSVSTTCGNGLNYPSTHQVEPLHLAALFLTVAALISVFAACYVITSILRFNPSSGNGNCPKCKCERSAESAATATAAVAPLNASSDNLDFRINVRNDLKTIKSFQKPSLHGSVSPI